MANEKIVTKIEKLCDGVEKKIKALSGNYLTNTYKRQNEQRHRDHVKEQHRQRLELLVYLKGEAMSRDLSAFENALLTGTFYEEMRILLKRHQRNTDNPCGVTVSVQMDDISEQHRKTLAKMGIADTETFIEGLTLFENIVRQAITPTDQHAVYLRDLIFNARLSQEGDVQFTPEPVAARIVELAGITPESKVLEPGAGIASIADKAKLITRHVDCVEIDRLFREILEIKGHTLVADDLFNYEQRPNYDAVLMNPPFSKEIEHIKYAFGFVKPGGTLVAVCGRSFLFKQNGGYPDFHKWLNQYELYYELVDGNFEMTSTSAAIVKIKKATVANLDNGCWLRVPYVSVWDGGIEVETTASVNIRTNEVKDIAVANVDGLDICERQYIVMNDEQVDVLENINGYEYWAQF